MKVLLGFLFLLGTCQALEHEDVLIQRFMEEAEAEIEARAEEMRGQYHFDMPGHNWDKSFKGFSELEKRNLMLDSVASKLSQERGLTTEDARKIVLSNRQFNTNDICNNENIPNCSQAEINSLLPDLTGRCNNVNRPVLGAVNRPFRRLLPVCDRPIFQTRNNLIPIQDEANDERQQSVQCNTGNILPNARLVTRTIHTDENIKSEKNVFFTMFSQFVCHDNLLTATISVPECCSDAARADTARCLSIFVPPRDPFFTTNFCLELRRAQRFCDSTGPTRSHTNRLTAYIDAGNIYSADPVVANALRTFSGGRLRVSSGNLLPILNLTGNPTFTAGETRVIENPALASIHTIFHREHNRIADLIRVRDYTQTDQEIYEKARRFVTAEYQNIVYGEWLNHVLGTNNVYPPGRVETRYIPSIDPSLTQEFASASFRFGHTTVNGFFPQNDPSSGLLLTGYLLRTSLNNVTQYATPAPDVGFTSIVNGMTLESSQTADNFVTQELTNFLYSTAAVNFTFGSDLASRNIQRGRDVGLNGWIFYRNLCGQPLITSWNDRPADVSVENWFKLRSLYSNVGDIDLFTGAFAETTTGNSALGFTNRCIIQDQFQRSLVGDRYFFGHVNGGSRFTAAQRQLIRRVTMFDIICLNTNIKRMPRSAFLAPSHPGNPMVPCTEAQSLDVGFLMDLP